MRTTTGEAARVAELGAAITAGAVRLAAASAAWLGLVAEFDARAGRAGPGLRSCAHWLSWQCGLSPGAAREQVRVARALRGLPRIQVAFGAGRLSYAKVRALTRIATPDCEAELLEFALAATASQTERFCRTWRRVDDQAAEQDSGRRAEPEVVFDYRTEDDGTFTLRVRGPAAQGAPLMAAIDSLAERAARRDRAQATRARAAHEQTRAAGGTVDADLVARCAGEETDAGLARARTAARRLAALAALAEARPALDRRPGDPPRREVVIHVDAAVLAEDTAAGRAYLEGGPAVTGAQARRVLCEASAVAMLAAGREPLAVGRRRRRATKAQRRALLRRDGGCARPGCPETRIERLHAHHLRHWLFGGRTDLPNLVLLCDTDHGLVHDLDLTTTRRDGRLVVTTPDGRRVWGGADGAFTGGLAGLDRLPATAPGLAGVPPLDTSTARRPTDAPALGAEHDIAPGARPSTARLLPRRPTGTHPTARPGRRTSEARRAAAPGRRPAGRRGQRGTTTARSTTTPTSPARVSRRIDRALFPDGAPDLPATLQDHHDPLDLRYAIGVLMTHRDLTRRLAVETGTPMPG
ncbi:HNH endonuclease signature motif containing protein [Geodermatophilus marinus]|uniref:HNH endonuclease signature motif containing protein n=1 Tax=Geodermatophilus sp. LHW52908 TaxID=2303986 RepID=UPI001F21292F|nr:HNH endonuclease signature motif containing protein [Geodermatophilus sp. LHW52908]